MSAPDALEPASSSSTARLRALFELERARWARVHPALDEAIGVLEALATGSGKRIRPALCYWGHAAAGGDPADDRLVDLMAGLELLHAFALAHDDVMDAADTRRGQPTVHRSFEAMHRTAGWHGDAAKFGEAGAVLLGDLGHVLADSLVSTLPAEVRAEWNELRLEVNVGQYLDVLAAATRTADLAHARAIVTYKTARYSVVRPLQLGARLAGNEAVAAALGRFGEPLGHAFQLRDDLLGVFGEPDVTGKPVGDDLREGKATELLAIARSRATPADQATLAMIGSPLSGEQIASIQTIMHATGAVAAVESRLDALLSDAEVRLAEAEIDTTAAHALRSLARYVAHRDH